MAASSSTEIPQSLEVTNIFEACINGLEKLCTYYDKNTTVRGFFGKTYPLSKDMRLGALYLLTEYLRILFYEFVKIEKASTALALSQDLFGKLIPILNQVILILEKTNLLRKQTIIDATKWIQACLLKTNDTPFKEPFPSQATLLQHIEFFDALKSYSHQGSGLLGEYFSNYKEMYSIYFKNLTILNIDLPDALHWFLTSPEINDRLLLAIKEKASRLYIYAPFEGDDGWLGENNHWMWSDSPTTLSPDSIKFNETKMAGVSIWFLFPISWVVSPFMIYYLTRTGDAIRRNKRAIELLNAKTPTDLLINVFERSTNLNRKAMTFALLVAIMWSFSTKQCDHNLSKGLSFFRNNLAPFAKEIIAAGKQYALDQNLLNTAAIQRDEGTDDYETSDSDEESSAYSLAR